MFEIITWQITLSLDLQEAPGGATIRSATSFWSVQILNSLERSFVFSLSIGLKHSNCVPIKISVLVTMVENKLRQVLKVRRATKYLES